MGREIGRAKVWSAAEIDLLWASGFFWQRFFGTDGMMTKKQRWLGDDENKPAKINRADYSPTAPLGVEMLAAYTIYY